MAGNTAVRGIVSRAQERPPLLRAEARRGGLTFCQRPYRQVLVSSPSPGPQEYEPPLLPAQFMPKVRETSPPKRTGKHTCGQVHHIRSVW